MQFNTVVLGISVVFGLLGDNYQTQSEIKV